MPAVAISRERPGHISESASCYPPRVQATGSHREELKALLGTMVVHCEETSIWIRLATVTSYGATSYITAIGWYLLCSSPVSA